MVLKDLGPLVLDKTLSPICMHALGPECIGHKEGLCLVILV